METIKFNFMWYILGMNNGMYHIIGTESTPPRNGTEYLYVGSGYTLCSGPYKTADEAQKVLESEMNDPEYDVDSDTIN